MSHRLLASGGLGVAAVLIFVSIGTALQRPVPVELSQARWVADSHRRGVTSVDVSADGTRILSGGLDGTVRLWDADSGGQLKVYRHHDGDVFEVAFLDDGSRFVSVGFDHRATIVDTRGGEVSVELAGFEGWPLSVAVSPNDDRIAVAANTGQVLVYDADDGTVLARMQEGRGGLAVAWDGPGETLSSAWSRIHLWDPGDGTHQLQLPGHPEGTRGLDFSPEGDMLATAGADKHIRIWDLSTGEPALEISPEGLLVMAPPGSGMEGAFQAPARLPVLTVEYTADGSLLLSGGSSRLIQAWDPSNGELAWQIAGHTASVTDLELSPDGTWLVSAALDGTLRRWSFPRP